MSDLVPEDLAARRAENDEIDRLLSLAGRRPRLPEREVAPAREAARAAWKRGRARASRRRIAQGAALAASVALVVLFGARERWFVTEPVRVSVPVGELVVRSGEVLVTGGPGASRRIGTGATIATGRDGRAALELAGGASLRLDVATFVRFESPTRVVLDRGAVYLDAHPALGRSPMTVETRLGTVRHVGTQFEVRLEEGREEKDAPDSLRVSVREGRVAIEHRGAVSEASAGSEVILRPDGSIVHAAASPEASAWNWTQQVAPEFMIEGRTLASYLEWVGRETGLQVRFSKGELEVASNRTVLHGSIAGLTPEESLAVVLPGCGLLHSRVGTFFRIESAEAP